MTEMKENICSRCWEQKQVDKMHFCEVWEKEVTWQTVYEQLQEIVNKCIELWWKPRWKEMLWINYSIIRTIRVEWKKIIIWWLDRMEMHDFYSYHDLFSVESGIMEFVEWEDKNLPNWYYITMCWMTWDEKVKRFVNNAIIPTK